METPTATTTKTLTMKEVIVWQSISNIIKYNFENSNTPEARRKICR